MPFPGLPPKLSLSKVTTTGAGTAFPAHTTLAKWSLQVILTGSPAGAVVALEGSNDGGTTWFALGTAWTVASQASGDILFYIDKPVSQVRANCTTLSGGASPTVTAYVAGC